MKEEKEAKSNSSVPGKTNMDRRQFLKRAAVLGGSGLFLSQMPWFSDLMRRAEAGELSPDEFYELSKPQNILYSVCLQCNTGCGIKVKLLGGVAAKIDGSPFSPWTLSPHLSLSTSPFTTARIDGTLCPKGQSGMQTAYDPYRIRKVLKRDGKRGENKWKIIPFEKAIQEITEGGNLFSHVSGEGSRYVEGLKDIWALRDPKVAKEMGADIEKMRHKEMTVDEFKKKHAENLDKLIDPNHPDMGPKNNQLVFMWGRLKGGRNEFIRRFTTESFGSTNAHGHTTVCQGSLYFTGKAMSDQYDLDEKSGKVKWGGGKKFYWQADAGNSKFVIFVGASPFEANYGPPHRAGKMTGPLVEGNLKYAIVDPRLPKTASKPWKWVPSKPGSEGALALGMIRWIIDHKRYNRKFLKNANLAAAKANGESSWSNATWLVKIDKDGKRGAFVRASELGIKTKFTRTTKDGKVVDMDPMVALVSGRPVAVDPKDATNAVEGNLFVDKTINGIRVKSAFQLLSESAHELTLEQVAEICGIKSETIVELAKEFTSHGNRAAADVHRGVSQHTNGFYNVFAWFSLNLLVGNYDWKGGMVQASTYDIAGEKDGKPFVFKKLHPSAIPAFGLSVIRHDAKYEESTLFQDYPAKRPWFPMASDIYQEILPSIGDAYPYPIKALFLYMGTPVYSLPAGHKNIEVLTDVNKVPLFIANDITIGETSMYADYIFPDISYLERWEFQGSHPSITWKVQPVRQPVIAPIPETVRVYGEDMPISLESMILGIAEKMKLPGFGKDGFSKGVDFMRQEDLYLKMVANVAWGDKPGEDVPEADADEEKLFYESRRHLPKSVFDIDKWRQAVPAKYWRRVIFILNRGGRFQDFEKGFDGKKVANKYGALINLYSEKAVKTKNSMTGKSLSGIAAYIPIQDSLGRPIEDEKNGFDLNLITHREIFHTKARTISNYYLLALAPENFVLINKLDADRLSIKDGERVKVVSASNPEGEWDLGNGRKIPMIGKAKVIQGIRPGVLSYSLGHGRWGDGASDVEINGKRIPLDDQRTKGIHANAALRVDPHLGNVCLEDLVGASAVFYDTKVKLMKV